MRTVAGAILLSAAAICFTVGGVFGRTGGFEAAAISAVLSGCLGLALLVLGLLTEGRGSGKDSP
ncbi:MAG: hypothetical protein ACYS9X_06860 [Planctomycetota bacterium]|jgi:hypothetical protein